MESPTRPDQHRVLAALPGGTGLVATIFLTLIFAAAVANTPQASPPDRLDAQVPGALRRALADPDPRAAVTLAAAVVADGRTNEAEDGLTPLAAAAAAGREDVVDLLLRAGADPNACGVLGSPLMRATTARHPRVVRRLLNAGARPPLDGPSPLKVALDIGRPDIAAAIAEAEVARRATKPCSAAGVGHDEVPSPRTRL